MKDHIRFGSLENQGEVVKLMAEPSHLHMLYKDIEDNRYYYFVLDKGMVIETVLLLSDISKMFDEDDVSWMKPTALQDGGVKFTLRYHDSYYSFDRHGDIYLESEKVGCQSLSIVTEDMGSVKAEISVRTRDLMFVAGVDTEYHEQVFMELVHPFNPQSDIKRRYFLTHGSGDLSVNAMAVDKAERKVWLGGRITTYADSVVSSVRPYLETFSF